MVGEIEELEKAYPSVKDLTKSGTWESNVATNILLSVIAQELLRIRKRLDRATHQDAWVIVDANK